MFATISLAHGYRRTRNQEGAYKMYWHHQPVKDILLRAGTFDKLAFNRDHLIIALQLKRRGASGWRRYLSERV